MPWIAYLDSTGEIAVAMQDAEPEAAEGQTVVRVPGSALNDPPLVVWSASERGFIDAPVLTTYAFLNLWTANEMLAVLQTTNAALARAWMLAMASPQIYLADSRIIAGIGLAEAEEILTEARAAQIISNVPPE